MENICVVTGGGSGMGLEAAKIIGKEQKIILVGRTVEKLENAVSQLKALDIDVEAFPCDVSNKASVDKLAAYAASRGNVKTVIHSAGVSGHMANAEKIFSINAVGTIYVDEAFSAIMSEGSCILNVSSMAAYMLQSDQIPIQIYKLSLQDPDAFLQTMLQVLSSMPEEQRIGAAYTMSKNFVVWYTAREAMKYGRKGIRVVSISPGTFKTPMGELEGKAAADFAMLGALGRLGEPEEIAKMMAFMVSDSCSYLCGADILYDGGTVAALNAMNENKAAEK